MQSIHNGVWPTMITPFNDDLSIDYGAAKAVTKWYLDRGVAGIFAVCLSSEMFCLSLDERVRLARTVVDSAGGTPVVASGHISDSMEKQIIEVNEMAQTGVAAVVLVTNRLAGRDESDEVWKSNLETILKNIPDEISVGFYECPSPYKRSLSTCLLRWCAQTGKALFYKDTSCSVPVISERVNAVKGTAFKIFNANSATLLDTLRVGASGFCGIMANFHPELYVWLCNNWNKQPRKAELLSSYLGIASHITGSSYPKCAKFAMQKSGLPMQTHCRCNNEELTELTKHEVGQLMHMDIFINENMENDYFNLTY